MEQRHHLCQYPAKLQNCEQINSCFKPLILEMVCYAVSHSSFDPCPNSRGPTLGNSWTESTLDFLPFTASILNNSLIWPLHCLAFIYLSITISACSTSVSFPSREQCSLDIRALCLETDCFVLAVWPWSSCLTYLCLVFFIWKMNNNSPNFMWDSSEH